MNKNNLQRYELAVYLVVGLLSLVLFLVGTFVITNGTINGMILNLSSELLGVAIIFFIVNRIFLLEGDDASQQGIIGSLSTKIDDIRTHLASINQDVTELTKKITLEVDHKQKQLLQAVEDKLASETHKSHENLRQAIERELSVLASQQGNYSHTVESLVYLVEQSITTMGSYQRITIEEETHKMFDELLENINKPVEDLSSEVKDLRQQLTALPVLRHRK